jgi:hypothetical protein
MPQAHRGKPVGAANDHGFLVHRVIVEAVVEVLDVVRSWSGRGQVAIQVAIKADFWLSAQGHNLWSTDLDSPTTKLKMFHLRFASQCVSPSYGSRCQQQRQQPQDLSLLL